MPTGIEAIAALTSQPYSTVDIAETGALGDSGAPGAFQQILMQQLDALNSHVGTAETAMRDLAAGKPIELHEVMIALEQARVSVQTFVQVRNKLLESYQDLMRMQL